MAGGFKVEGSIKTAICKPSDGVKENKYHAVLGEKDDGVKVRHAEGGPLYEIGVKIWGWIRVKLMAGGFKVEGVYKNCNM